MRLRHDACLLTGLIVQLLIPTCDSQGPADWCLLIENAIQGQSREHLRSSVTTIRSRILGIIPSYSAKQEQRTHEYMNHVVRRS
jgi:hypothetical protein